jgi:hypothetical protein
MGTGRRHLRAALAVAVLGGSALAPVPAAASAAVAPTAAAPADRDQRHGDHRGTHRWDETGGSNSESSSSAGTSTSSSRNENRSRSGSNGSSPIEVNHVLDNSLDNLSIHILGG